MKLVKIGILAITCISCLSNQAFAQLKLSQTLSFSASYSKDGKNPVVDHASTLMEVYETALQKNIPYLMDDRNYQQVLTRIAQAKSKLKPQITADAESVHGRSYGSYGQSYMNTSAGINGTWVIYDKELNLGVDIATLDAQMAERQLVLAQQELMVLVAQAYLDLILKEDLVKLTTEKVADLKSLEEFTNSRVNQGALTADQLSYVRADLRRTEIKLYEATMGRDDSQKKFENEFGIYFKPFLSARDIGIPQLNTQSRSGYIDEAERTSLKIQIQQIAVEIANKDISRAKAISSPTVTLQANVGAGIQSNRNSALYNDSGRGSFVGIFLKIPLYDGGLRSAVTKENVYKQESAELSNEQARRQTRFDVDEAINQYSLAVSTITNQREIINLTNDVIKKAKESYSSGNIDYTKLLLETGKLYDFKYELAQANVKALTSFIQLKQAVGSINGDDLAAISSSLRKGKH